MARDGGEEESTLSCEEMNRDGWWVDTVVGTRWGPSSTALHWRLRLKGRQRSVPGAWKPIRPITRRELCRIAPHECRRQRWRSARTCNLHARPGESIGLADNYSGAEPAALMDYAMSCSSSQHDFLPVLDLSRGQYSNESHCLCALRGMSR
jgi:hypothetical protein